MTVQEEVSLVGKLAKDLFDRLGHGKQTVEKLLENVRRRVERGENGGKGDEDLDGLAVSLAEALERLEGEVDGCGLSDLLKG